MAVDLQIPSAEQRSSLGKSLSLKMKPPVLPDVANGQPEAIENCLDRYGSLVWSLALRSCPDEQAAEDAVQDIFLKVWQAADRFDPACGSEETFVAMIARRRLIDLYRKRRGQQHVSVDSETVAFEPSRRQEASSRAELNDDARQAERFLSQLPKQQQRVIRLSVYDGLSHSSIAGLTGIALGTVKTYIRRGLGELQRQLFAVDSQDNAASSDGGSSQ